MSLREPESLGDIGLRAVAKEEEQHDPPLSVVQTARSACYDRAVEEDVVECLVRARDLVADRQHRWRHTGDSAGTPDGRCSIAQVMPDLALDAARQVCRQFGARRIAPVDRSHERKRPDLSEVVGPFATARVPSRHTARER
jgi:hypothetical protein